MAEFMKSLHNIVWTAPNGSDFVIKTLEHGYTRKHIGEVTENPKTTRSSSSSSRYGGGKKSKTSASSSVSTSQSTKRVQDSNDTFNDLGIGGRDISLDCYFTGENHAVQAKEFENALCLVGKSKLRLSDSDELTVNVISFKKKNSLVENINVTVISVNWHETSKSTYPKSEKSKSNEVKKQAAAAKTSAAQNLADTVEGITTPNRLANFQTSFTNALNNVSNALSTGSNITLKSIMTDIMGQNIASNAFTMASQLGVVMYKAAALGSKVKNLDNSFSLSSNFGTLYGGFNSLISLLKSSSKSSSDKTALTTNEIDNLIINDTTAAIAVSSLAESLVEAEFETREEAVEAAKVLEQLSQDWTEHVEEEIIKIENLEDVFIRDSGLTEIAATAANEILERSYKLKVEKVIVLSEDTTTIDFAYEYYPDEFEDDPDNTIKYLITTNGFSDDEFFLLKRGTEVKIYV